MYELPSRYMRDMRSNRNRLRSNLSYAETPLSWNPDPTYSGLAEVKDFELHTDVPSEIETRVKDVDKTKDSIDDKL